MYMCINLLCIYCALLLHEAGKRDAIFGTLSELYSHPSLSVLHPNVTPEPYNLDDQLKEINKPHHRRRRMSTCCNDDRYVLFVLDTSGSIGRTTFTKMVKSLSDLVPVFCKNTRIAAMTFGTHIYHEFCFDCFENDDIYRTNLKEAVSSIPFHSGTTHTGRALKCACDEILSTKCGLPSEEYYKNCSAPIDVVVITDGHSNGPLDVCETAKCLRKQDVYDVNTFAIGVDNFDQTEMDCIVDKKDYNAHNIFYVDDFTEFQKIINDILFYLALQPEDGGRTCFKHNS